MLVLDQILILDQICLLYMRVRYLISYFGVLLDYIFISELEEYKMENFNYLVKSPEINNNDKRKILKMINVALKEF